MTVEEAIAKCQSCNNRCPQAEMACEIAKGRMYATDELIKCQKELEQYRAIGTVKVFETVIKSQMDYFYRLREYEKIGTVSEFREIKNFLEFLYNAINPNEMEQYLAMYHASGRKGE